MDNIVNLKVHLLQSCKEFILANNLDPRRWTHNRHTGELRTYPISLMFNADVNRPEDPEGYQAEITVRGEKILMPPGRLVHIGHTAGHIDSIDSIMPLNTIFDFEEMKSLCGYMEMRFALAGFKPVRLNSEMTEQEFHEKNSPSILYGKWQSDSPAPMYLAVRMENFNRMATTSFNTILAEPTPRNALPKYLIDARHALESKVTSELDDLEYARRLAIHGDRDKPFPLKVWFDDPDWRPADWQGKWLK